MTKEEFRKLKKGDIVVCNFLGKKGVVCTDKVQFDKQAVFIKYDNYKYLTLMTIKNCKGWIVKER